MNKYIMALDQGTTSSRCVLYDQKGKVVSIAQQEFEQIYPKAGWVEHDPMEIWSKQLAVAQEALYKIDATYLNLEAIGITNQRETTIVWDKETGAPIYNAIVWQCRRTAKFCDELKENKELEKKIKEKTGLPVDAYFSATKLKWILDNVKGAREKADAGKLLFGTVETWLVWKLTSGKLHITDYTNASRTMLFNINTLNWDNELLELLDIPIKMLPKPVQSSQIYGNTDKHIFGGEIPIAGIAGDQHAALFGQTCFDKGNMKNTYGTGCFLLMNTGDKPVFSKNGLITTIAWGMNGKVNYALEGSVFIGGAVVQWLRDELGIISNSKETESMAMKVKNSNGVSVVPAFSGLGAPYWDSYARGAILGLTRGVNRNHIVRAALESIALQVNDLINAIEEDTGFISNSLNVDGGASENNFIMQFQANILTKTVIRYKNSESTSLGAAYLAGLAVGFWKNKEELKRNKDIYKIYMPNMREEEREESLAQWEKAVKLVLK